MSTTNNQKQAAKQFVRDWSGKGYEKGETQRFWLDLLHTIFGIDNPSRSRPSSKRRVQTSLTAISLPLKCSSSRKALTWTSPPKPDNLTEQNSRHISRLADMLQDCRFL